MANIKRRVYDRFGREISSIDVLDTTLSRLAKANDTKIVDGKVTILCDGGYKTIYSKT